ncbi:CAMPATH-1 antigen-like [Peromyscus californicus insignis]|uniref:CAMPATH-1 antigen-like n=1 Tax=Peromyscus californicus insignis TaxID=564181 RepID=UPI0022A743D8|nr:CAMPATH-1 antigen-like [Peromyscus californicus insignis]
MAANFSLSVPIDWKIQKHPNSKRPADSPELISQSCYRSPGRSRMNGFLLVFTISLLVAVQIQTGVLGQNDTQAKPPTPAAGITIKLPAKPAKGGAPSLINVGACSFFFFANTFMCLVYLG